jgi:hypothetical protein
MFNLARQGFASPFQSVGASFQPGAFGSVGKCPVCGNAVSVGSTLQPQIGGINPMGIGATLGQQAGGAVPTPDGISQSTAFGQINPLAAQFPGGVPTGINPMLAQLATNWPGSGHLSQQGVGGRTGAYGIDPRYAFGTGQQFGYTDPNAVAGSNPSVVGDPISSLFSQQQNPLAQQQQNPLAQQQLNPLAQQQLNPLAQKQLNPLAQHQWNPLAQQQWNPLAQQQLPIRPLIAGQQGLGSQSVAPGFGPTTTQWADPYRAFIEAQLISQLANNPLFQLQRAYGGVPELTGQGMPFAGQQFNPLFSNVPFYG